MWHRSAALAAVVLSCAVSGCANYRAVSEFGTETTRMTGVVRTELVTLNTLCMQQAEMQTAVMNVPDDRILDTCERNRVANGRYAKVTIDVLDQYAEALSSLADDKRFDIDPGLKRDVTKLGALKDRAGNALIGADELGTLGKIVAVLGEIAETAKRDEAVRRMVQATPDLHRAGASLKGYFVAAPGAPSTTVYTNTITFVDRSARSTGSELKRARTKEPIRAFELMRILDARQPDIDARTAKTDEAVPARIGVAIDAWLDALDDFAVHALKPDAREWVDRLKRLRNATRAAKAD
jgi:hypothetical protein